MLASDIRTRIVDKARSGLFGLERMPLSPRTAAYSLLQMLVVGAISAAACGAAVSIVATLAFWSHLNSALIRPLKDGTLTTLAMAGCDLSQVVHAERSDEMGQMMRALRQVNVNLQAIIGDVRGVAGGMSTASEHVSAAATSLSQARASSIQKTSALVQEIAAASQEQASGVSQINGAVTQLNQATQQNASASEQLAATAEEMSGQAVQLQDLMAYFKLDSQTSGQTQWPTVDRRRSAANDRRDQREQALARVA